MHNGNTIYDATARHRHKRMEYVANEIFNSSGKNIETTASTAETINNVIANLISSLCFVYFNSFA